MEKPKNVVGKPNRKPATKEPKGQSESGPELDDVLRQMLKTPPKPHVAKS